MKRVLSLLLTALMLFTLWVTPIMAVDTINESDTPVADDVSVSAYAAIVVDMDTGKVLYGHDADEKNYPASCTKVMTAYLCLKYGDPDDMITISSSAFSNLSTLASTWNLRAGEEMTVYQALQCMLVVSACEAANAIGEYVSGSQEEFVKLMNQEAQALGCTGTQFANCHGLPNSNHYTTARDLSIIAQAAMEYDVFREIVGSAVNVLEATNVHKSQKITSTNGLLPGSSYPKYNYEYAIGIKTGHSSTAGYNLISAANKDGQELMVVVMGCGTRESSFAQSIKLYEWAYENYDILTWGDSAEAPEIEEAPEYVEVETSVVDEEEIIIVEEVGEPLEETEPPAAEETPQPSASPEEPVVAAESAEVEVPPADLSSLTLSSIPASVMPIFIFMVVAFLVLILLIVLLIVVLIRRRRQ